MFGQKDDQQANEPIPEHSIDGALGDQGAQANYGEPSTAPPVASDQSAVTTDDQWQHPGVPLTDSNTDEAPQQVGQDVISPAGGFPKAPSFPTAPSVPVQDSSPSPAPTASNNQTDDLIDIKQHALTELEPLIDKLDQNPEERYRTLMMLIQATDDQELIEKAYAAAHQIEDEKVRAQALLDIVNEINYFTQQAGPEA